MSTAATLRVIARKFKKHIPDLSVSCARCFGENAVCVYANCRDRGCSVNPLGEACLACARASCRAAFDACSGLSEDNRPPEPVVNEAGTVSPDDEEDDGATSPTFAPAAVDAVVDAAADITVDSAAIANDDSEESVPAPSQSLAETEEVTNALMANADVFIASANSDVISVSQNVNATLNFEDKGTEV